MTKITKKYVNFMLTRGGDVNNALYVNNNKIKDYEITSLNTSDFS